MSVDIRRDDDFYQVPILSPAPTDPKQQELWEKAHAHLKKQGERVRKVPDQEEAGRRRVRSLLSFPDFCKRLGIKDEVRWPTRFDEEDSP